MLAFTSVPMSVSENAGAMKPGIKDSCRMSAYKYDYCGKWYIGHERLTQQDMELTTEHFQEKMKKSLPDVYNLLGLGI